MYQLLLKQRFKFAVRMVKRNIGAYLILIAIVPCILILQSMIQKNYGMDIAVFIPYGILCFLFMNLFGTIPRMESEEDRKKHGTDVECCVDFILGFSNGGNGLKTVYCGYAL